MKLPANSKKVYTPANLDFNEKEIETYYKDKDLVILIVQTGAIMFGVDLVKRLQNLNPEIGVIKVKSYGNEFASNKVPFVGGIEIDVRDRNVLIVEDIVSTGKTCCYLLAYLQSKGARDIQICTLIDDEAKREYQVNIMFSVITTDAPSAFFFGYGLDYRGRFRHLNDIYELNRNEQTS